MSETNTSQQPDQQLQITDLTLALDAIQIAASRGAFRANEFSTIGGCFDRIYGFLVASGAIKPPESESQATEQGN